MRRTERAAWDLFAATPGDSTMAAPRMQNLERRIAAIFGLVIAGLLGLGVLVVASALRNAASFREVDEATRVLRAAEDVLIDLLNIQTATRGYLLTGEESFLTPYRDGMEDMPKALLELEDAVAIKPSHHSRVARIRALEQRLAEIIETRLAARRARNFELEAMRANLREGKELMDALRAEIVAIENAERAILRHRSAVAREGAGEMLYLMAALGFAALGAVAFAGYRATREIRARAHSEAQLRELNNELESRVQRRTAELTHTAHRLQSLSHQLLTIQENERRRLAQELHDEIGQAMTAVKISLQTLQRSPPASTALPASLNKAVEITARCLEQTRSLSLNLRPPMLDDLGLGVALHWLVSRHVGGPKVHLRENLDDARLSPELEIACFRTAQEALANALKHARATTIEVSVQRQGRSLMLAVSDDGVGFDYGAAKARAVQEGTSLGLIGLEERVSFAGGSLHLTSQRGRGTQLRAEFPLAFPA